MKTVQKRLTVVQNSESTPCIVSMAQHAMLVFIEEHPGALYDEVAEHIGFDCPTTTAYASRLERIKLLQRTLIKLDGRRRTQLTLQDNVQLHFNVLYST